MQAQASNATIPETWTQQHQTYVAGTINTKSGFNVSMCWTDFLDRMKNYKVVSIRPQRDDESDDAYKKYLKAPKDSAGVFLAGAVQDARKLQKNIISRWMITLDVENGDTQKVWDLVKGITGYAVAMYTTFKNKLMDDTPHFRILIPLQRDVTPDEFKRLTHALWHELGGTAYYDSTCDQYERAMYNPSTGSLNKEHYQYWYNNAENFLDPDKYLMMDDASQDDTDISEDYKKDTEDTHHRNRRKNYKRFDLTRQEHAMVLDALDALDAGMCCYDEWLNVGFALYNCNFEFSVWNDWSEQDADGYPGHSAMRSHWRSFATEDPSYNASYIFNLTANKTGWKPDKVQLEYKVTRDGLKVVQSAVNVEIALTQDPLLSGHIRYDEFRHVPVAQGALPWHGADKAKDTDIRGWTDADDAYLRMRLEKEYDLKVRDDMYKTAFSVVSHDNGFNPVIDMLESLPEWDGEKHIRPLLCDYLGAKDSDYVEYVLTAWMGGAIARAYHPGTKFDYMPVLISEQGLGKTSFISRMSLDPDFFLEHMPSLDKQKEAAEMLQGKWIVNMSELSSIKSAKGRETVKQFLTQTADTYRAPYARRTEQRLRTCVFIGDTNDWEFLTDLTGNRRFLPIDLQRYRQTKDQFENEYRTMHDIQMAWAEALAQYKFYEQEGMLNKMLKLPPHVEEEANRQQDLHREEDPWEVIIGDRLDDGGLLKQVTTQQLWDFIFHSNINDFAPRYADAKPAQIKRITMIMNNQMQKIGWVNVGRKYVKTENGRKKAQVWERKTGQNPEK